MKPITTNQEIMLIIGTRFLGREVCPVGKDRKPDRNSQIPELERACWAGLIFDLLPELSSPPAGSKTFTWNVHSTTHFVMINLGTEPLSVEDAFSLDPYYFIDKTRLN